MPVHYINPFRPGAGHRPPYLAGRQKETDEFQRLLKQNVILDNFVLTGLRGVGKTVLLDTFKPQAISVDWLWVGTDLSESASISEDRMALRILTDLSVVTSHLKVSEHEVKEVGFTSSSDKIPIQLDFKTLQGLYNQTPGLQSDKLKYIMEIVWAALRANGQEKGMVFAYDEAQNLADHSEKDEYPLSLLLDVFQSTQRKGIPFMLVLVGLPTMFPKLVEARTFSERMFRVEFLDRLSDEDSRDAITKPIEESDHPISFKSESIDLIVSLSGGYPYFIQFICREAYDSFVQGNSQVPINEITIKLDSDFFAGRWARATDRQRELLMLIAQLETADAEFTVQEIVEKSKQDLLKPFSSSLANQMLATLSNNGLIYKNRHGKYSFAVPLMDRFIRRQIEKE